MRNNYLLLLLLFALQVNAAEFPWFKVADNYEGFVEFMDGNQATRKIYVMPVLGLPGTAFYLNNPWGFSPPTSDTGVEIADNGNFYYNFKIHTNPEQLPSNFKEQVLNQITSNGFNTAKYNNLATSNYIIQFIKPQNIRVALWIDNILYESKAYSGILDANFKDKFLIPQDKINLIRNGKFEIKIDYDFPYQNFSSLSINIREEQLTKVKIDVFKELIQQSSSSSGGMLFWKWKQRTHRVIERNRVNFDASHTSTSDISIVYRDATPEMMERVNTILGFYSTTRATLVEQHRGLLNLAMSSGNTSLADLHRRYIDAVNTDDVSKGLDVLRAAAALNEGDLFSFLASGIAFSDEYSSSYSSFHGIKRVSITSTAEQNYNELMTNTVAAKFNGTGFKPATMKNAINDGYKERNVKIFGSHHYLTPDMWHTQYLQAAVNDDLVVMKYLTRYFAPVANPNSVSQPNNSTTLHIAAGNGNLEMVKELLKFGVNPQVRNRYNETARDIAMEKGYPAIVSLLDQPLTKGTIDVVFTLPSGNTIQAIEYLPLESIYMPGLDNRPNMRRVTGNTARLSYYPGTYNVGFTVYYRDAYGQQNMALITNIYRFKAANTISYSEILVYMPSSNLLTNGNTMFGQMTEPVYFDY